MTALDWGVWIGYELAVAVAVFAKSVFWFRRQFRVTRLNLASWVGLLLLAFFAAIGLGQWLEANFLAALVAYSLASAMIVSAAVNATCEAGLRGGERMRDNEARRPMDE